MYIAHNLVYFYDKFTVNYWSCLFFNSNMYDIVIICKVG